MILLSGVTIDGDALARNAARSTVACGPSIIFSAMTRDELANRRMDSKRLDAMTGIPTLSSKAPLVVDNEMVVSLPITCAHTIDTASTMTGLTLPGIIDDPGWRSGMLSSPRPVFGPDPIQRRSLLIFNNEYAMLRSWLEASTNPSRLAWASKWLRASVIAKPDSSDKISMTRCEKPMGVLIPVPTAVPPNGTSATRGRAESMRSTP